MKQFTDISCKNTHKFALDFQKAAELTDFSDYYSYISQLVIDEFMIDF